MMTGDDREVRIRAALARIANCNDPKQLRQMAVNAEALGIEEVRSAALLKLYDVLPSAMRGTLEFDVWRSIHALEDTLSGERGKTTRLARTRQKITRDGELKTVEDLVLGKISDGFKMLVERSLPHLTFESVVLRHTKEFSSEVISAARNRLIAAGFDPDESRFHQV